MPAELKSLAHPEWPYAGTAHEWRGFVKDKAGSVVVEAVERWRLEPDVKEVLHRRPAVYQKQNFGPELK